MTRVDKARALCAELKRVYWCDADENERELIAAEIAGLTTRPATSLSERVLEEMRDSDG